MIPLNSEVLNTCQKLSRRNQSQRLLPSPQRIIFLSLLIQYLTSLLSPEKHLAAVFKFNQISHLCCSNDCSEKWITGPNSRANSSGSDYFKPHLTYQVSTITVPPRHTQVLKTCTHFSFCPSPISPVFVLPSLRSGTFLLHPGWPLQRSAFDKCAGIVVFLASSTKNSFAKPKKHWCFSKEDNGTVPKWRSHSQRKSVCLPTQSRETVKM